DVGAWNSPDTWLLQRWEPRGLHIAVLVKMYNLDWLHGRADGDFSNYGADLHPPAQRFGKLIRNQQSTTCDAEQLRVGVVIVLMSFDIEKREAGFGVAHRKIEPCVGRRPFYDELFKRSS